MESLRCIGSIKPITRKVRCYVHTTLKEASYKHSYFLHIENMIHKVPDKYTRVSHWKECDVAFVELRAYREFNADPATPSSIRYVIIELNDAATCLVRELRNPNCKAVLKPCALTSFDMHKGPLFHGRHHFTRLERIHRLFNAENTSVESSIRTEDFKKVRCILPHMTRFLPRFKDYKPVPLRKRTIDVAFLGTIDYGNSHGRLVTQNRKLLIDRLRQICPPIVTYCKDSKVSYAAYLDVLKQTKIFVSPYGWGEFSHKDFEIALTGGILIKPDCHNFVSYPNIYEDGVTCVNCRLDYSDLQNVVEDLLAHPEKMERIAANVERLVQDFYNTDKQEKDFSLFMDTLITT